MTRLFHREMEEPMRQAFTERLCSNTTRTDRGAANEYA